jgi:hypothetical protein
MRDTLQEPDRRREGAARSPRVAWPTIAFWLGGSLLGTGGCILGLCMPYQHPVAVAMSALWWGIYSGSFGATVGAVIALSTERARACASAGPVNGRS